MWKQSIPTTMQDFGDYCASMPIHGTISLYDIRDNKSYEIIKFKDEKCWMSNPLNISNYEAKPQDSDVQQDFLIPASTTNFGFTRYDIKSGLYFDASKDATFYSWGCMTAMSAGANTQKAPSGDAPYSICSKGWHLPSKTEAEALINMYPNFDSTLVEKFHITNLGYKWPDNVNVFPGRDDFDIFLTKTGKNDSRPYALELSATRYSNYWRVAGGYDDLGFGYTVRCISD